MKRHEDVNGAGAGPPRRGPCSARALDWPLRRTRAGGFTLVELAVVLAVLALLVTAGVPSFGAALARHRLQAAARHLQADLALARQQAVAHGQSAHLSLQAGAQWCWALSLGMAVDCRSARPGAFDGGQVLKVVHAEDHPNTALAQAVPMALDARSGTRLSAPGQALFTSRHGDRLAVQLSTLGRAHVCAPAAPVNGVPPCTAP